MLKRSAATAAMRRRVDEGATATGNGSATAQTTTTNAASGKRRRREKRSSNDESGSSAIAGAAPSSALAFRPSQARYKNRTLVMCTRGITARYRHLMEDLRNLMPHHKRDSKLDSKDNLRVANELAEINGCNNTILFEARKKRDLYLWLAKTPNGPSVKFHVVNVHTMDELRLTGNCLKGSRPVLSFDKSFESAPHLQLLKELFTQAFYVPSKHPKSQPFHDHVMGFYVVDGKIWIRHYQILDETHDPKERARMLAAGEEPTSLVEIGPRFVCDIIRIFGGAFGGPTLYQNAHYVSPNKQRHDARLAAAKSHAARAQARSDMRDRKEELVVAPSPLDGVFGASGEVRSFDTATSVLGQGEDM